MANCSFASTQRLRTERRVLETRVHLNHEGKSEIVSGETSISELVLFDHKARKPPFVHDAA